MYFLFEETETEGSRIKDQSSKPRVFPHVLPAIAPADRDEWIENDRAAEKQERERERERRRRRRKKDERRKTGESEKRSSQVGCHDGDA